MVDNLWLTAIGAALAGAALFRIRGGWLVSNILPTFAGRLIWALGTTVVVALTHGVTMWLAALPIALFAGALPGWYGGFDLGRRGGRSYWRDAGVLLVRGLWWTLPALPVFGLLDWPLWLSLIGAATWPCYEASWRLAGDRGPVYGEALFGAVIVTAMATA